MKEPYELAILGAGSAGFAAASVASKAAIRVALIDEAEKLGGLCILKGCMPSKTFIESSNRFWEIQQAKNYGLNVENLSADMLRIQKRKRTLVEEFAQGREEEMLSLPIDFIRGRASFISPHELVIKQKGGKERLISSKTFIIATGSVIDPLPIPGLAQTGFLTSDSALELERLPGSLTILGGGAVGCEFAQFFSRLGCKTTIIQRSPRLVKSFDPEVSECLREAFLSEGIGVFSDTQIEAVTKENGYKKVSFLYKGKKTEVFSEEILYALGRKPNVEKLGLEKIGIDIQVQPLSLNDKMQTAIPHIFVAGDASGNYGIVHIAREEGEIAAKNALEILAGKPPSNVVCRRLTMEVVFTDPQVAMVGLWPSNRKALCAKYFFKDHGKAIIEGKEKGFVKICADPSSAEILFGTIIGPHASELIHQLSTCIYYRGTVEDLLKMPFYHPTLSEILSYPAEEIFSRLKEKKEKTHPATTR
ncbi:dihydrolipoyl dehydrogenase family protein [Candidatus Methylacidiphilum infernorum]|uniref:Pyruvate/2-oxoglutarate dehydrogenase complex, dihydrolipoamide dehydrogenase (E3) component or related enzyme n=1 Tax=Methylacidiphilum infernorum (isolate V4) TaxID=481448 RepID=B3DWM6_METI4|nr:dihydrolipoyl dehydrogenase [Candidatus Methylacidiphilum infernorum]ACD83689.1 Pyruvate/2-oxoglutarate dehydrogenase complex, dihydrolipoamide dehydrogenase (E3) component or related enzyme [Methylacidiphilum infernorum V4]